jgi:hypothetical protein
MLKITDTATITSFVSCYWSHFHGYVSIMKFRFVFWFVLPCKIILDRRLRGKCCLHDQGSTYLWNVGPQLFYAAVHPRRQIWTSYSPPWELKISISLQVVKSANLKHLLHPQLPDNYNPTFGFKNVTYKEIIDSSTLPLIGVQQIRWWH